MNRYDYLAWPAYAVAFVLVVVPFFDVTMSLWPLNPGSEQWRFGAIGLLSNAFMIPATGLLVALVTALLLGHWRFLRVFGVFCAIGAAVVFLLLLLFVLDAIQTRLNIQPAAKLSFAVASFTAGAKLILAMITLIGMALAGIKTRRDRASRSAARVPDFSA